MTFFTVVHNDGDVTVRIDETGYATLRVGGILDHVVIALAISRAYKAGARRGTLFTGSVVNDNVARMQMLRATRGTTFLGGKVTRLDDSPQGDPQFRVDWDEFPQITE